MPDPADAPAPSTADNIPTMTIRPNPKTEGDGGTAKTGPGFKGGNAPAKLSYDDMVAKWQARGYPKAAAQGIADNMTRESGGDPTAIGDGGTSRGLFQEHATRKAELEAAAKKQGVSPDDPDLQIDFADQELKTKFPTLYKQLKAGTDRGEAEDSFKRVFERPASVMWQNNPNLSSDRYRFSDYALNEHNDRPNTDVMMMAPQDYLDLTPDLEGAPFKSPSGRSLVKSVNNGDEVQSIPSLDMRVSGKTGTVTDQDGRHRALLAQQEGLDAIPVAVHKTGQGDPTEMQGMSGTILPFPSTKADAVPKSLWQKAANAVMPSAEAAEPTGADDGWVTIPEHGSQQQGQSGASQAADADGWVTIPHPSGGQPDNMAVSALKGASEGAGKAVFGGQELLGKGLEAASDWVSPPVDGQRGMVGRAGESLVNDARDRLKTEADKMAADHAAHPWATGAGDMAGNLAMQMLLTRGKGGFGGNALSQALTGGGLGGLLAPVGDDSHYWGKKTTETAIGSAFGAGTNALAHLGAWAVAPTLRRAVNTLVGEGVELTPGQMLGGGWKRAEDILAAIPVLGSMVRAGQRRSMETFDRAAINRGLADINSRLPPGLDAGHDAMAYAEQQFRDAYNQVIPGMRGVLDPTFLQDLNAIMLRAHARGTPRELPQEYADRLNFIIQDEIIHRFDPATGHISGDLAQNIGTRLDELIEPMTKSDNPYTQKIGYALREADKAFDNMLAAHNPTLAAAKERIDAGYAKFKTVQRAASYSDTHPDGTFTPSQLNRSVNARDPSKDKSAYAKGDALMQDLADAARDVLPQKVNDSGTVERAILAGGLGKLGTIEPHTAVGLGLASVPYLKPSMRVLNAAASRMARTPPSPNALLMSNLIRRGAPYAGAAAGTLATGGGSSIPTMSVPRTIPPEGGQ